MAYRIVAKSPKHLNDIVEDIMSWFETAREYRTQFDTESIKFADPVTKQVSGFRDIDVLHVQDITTGKKTVIKFIPLLRPEEMKIVMGGENEHVMKGKIKNMMKGRGEFKTYNKDTLRKMESQMKASEFRKLIREEVKKILKEVKRFEFSFDYNTDEDDVRYIQNLLDKAGSKAVARAGLGVEEMEVIATNAQELAKAKKAIQANGFQIN